MGNGRDRRRQGALRRLHEQGGAGRAQHPAGPGGGVPGGRLRDRAHRRGGRGRGPPLQPGARGRRAVRAHHLDQRPAPGGLPARARRGAAAAVVLRPLRQGAGLLQHLRLAAGLRAGEHPAVHQHLPALRPALLPPAGQRAPARDAARPHRLRARGGGAPQPGRHAHRRVPLPLPRGDLHLAGRAGAGLPLRGGAGVRLGGRVRGPAGPGERGPGRRHRRLAQGLPGVGGRRGAPAGLRAAEPGHGGHGRQARPVRASPSRTSTRSSTPASATGPICTTRAWASGCAPSGWKRTCWACWPP